ncbi:MAG: (Fe-S)-binding protein [Rhodothermales bacterium]|nr:(Fe-S)-binding protein [Rhodothermales bacterium]
MNVGLFVPCFIEQYYPEVAIATLDLLEKHGCKVTIPDGQTCCGQPLANAGFESSTVDVAGRFADLFETFEYVVAPSASCALHVRDHYRHFSDISNSLEKKLRTVGSKTYEVCEFLYNVVGVRSIDVTLQRRIGIHPGCHGLRGMRLGVSSELMQDGTDIVRSLLETVHGIDLVELARADECCGFGGTFSISEEAVSVRMGRDRLADHVSAGAEIITSTDMSCLMHMQGLARRSGSTVRFCHVTQILSGAVT